MTTRRAIRALGAEVQVDLGDDIDPREFSAAWSRCLVSEDEAAPARGEQSIGPAATMSALTQSITRALIERRRGELLMLHAGAVCHPSTGTAVAYVAPGGTGKTTLTRLLGGEFGYLTDETVAVEPATWRILPYPKPLSFRRAESGLGKEELGPDELGLGVPTADPVLRTLAILRRTDGGSCSITRLGVLDAVMMLAPETSSLSAMRAPLQLLARLEEDLGGFWLVEYGDATDAAPWFRERLAS